jgi:predicted RNA-binding Zn-ribbon protein involved in translation (DUF1610 family)
MLKEKVSKKKQHLIDTKNNDSSTLDEKHKQMIITIQEHIETNQHLEEEQYNCEVKLLFWKDKIKVGYLNNLQNTSEYSIAWDSNLYYTDKLKYIKQKMKELNDVNSEIEYYEDTGTILFDYYELLNKQEIAGTYNKNTPIVLPTKISSKGRKKMLPAQQKNILEAFQFIQKEEEQKEDTESEVSIDEDVNKPIKDKMTLVNEYLLAIDHTHMKTLNDSLTNQCERCEIAMNCLAQEGIMICPSCGYQEIILVEQNRPIYRQSNKEASHYTYKRINHFNEWISQIQGKESTDIPEEIFEKIVNEIKKEKIKDLSKLSYHKMREILKKINTNKYYEHIYYIIYRLNGVPAPNFSPELEEKLRNMFKEIQAPFLKYCPSNRKNFLSYSYVLYKFCQLLEKDEYLKYFSLLKSREKLHLQDQIWKKICDEVNWEFIQSI